MQEMSVRYRDLEGGRSVVLGLCPGCDNWQLDYTHAVEDQYVAIGLDPGRDGEGSVVVDRKPWIRVLEFILWEHMAECPHLRELYEESLAE